MLTYWWCFFSPERGVEMDKWDKWINLSGPFFFVGGRAFKHTCTHQGGVGYLGSKETPAGAQQLGCARA